MTDISSVKQSLTRHVWNKYVSSGDFNGTPVAPLAKVLGFNEDQIKQIISQLMHEGKLTLCFEDSGNPHIKRLPDRSLDEQLKKLQDDSIQWICAYPSSGLLKEHVNVLDFSDRPYTKLLYLGHAQLEPCYFDMGVLERYRNDPRYHFDFDYFSGMISIASEYYEKDHVPERDQVVLESFGLAISKKKDRKIAAFLRYLHNLTSDHQQYWKSYEISSKGYILAPEYFTPSIIGDFPTHEPIYNGVLEEMRIINATCDRIGKPKLFRETFEDGKPLEFGIFLRPTQNDFNAFVLATDKILSENLNQRFFGSWSQIALESTTQNQNGTITESKKGTVQLLEDWLRSAVLGVEDDVIRGIVQPFREVRKLRQNPAHKFSLNKYDDAFYEKQRDIMKRTYISVRDIRLILSSHPLARGVDVPDWLQEGRLRNY